MERRLSSPLRATAKRISTRSKASAQISGNTRLNSTSAASDTLGWAEYLSMRRSRHLWQNAATIPGSVLGLFGGASYFASLETDPLKPIMGVDPFMFYGACTGACGVLGFVVGPTIGATAWRLFKGKAVTAFDAKDAQFYQRIAKNRVDASLQSPTSPVPDYYGEKIGSLHQYRTWLRDQSKYRKKAVLPEN